eukprot:2493977-Prorocentrum_lima.AAC.1
MTGRDRTAGGKPGWKSTRGGSNRSTSPTRTMQRIHKNYSMHWRSTESPPLGELFRRTIPEQGNLVG